MRRAAEAVAVVEAVEAVEAEAAVEAEVVEVEVCRTLEARAS